MPGQEAFDARHDPLPRPPALHVDVAVPAFARTGVTDKAMTAPLQFLVQYVQHQVRQQRRDHSLNAKGNFRFERTIVDWRSGFVLDLRRKE